MTNYNNILNQIIKPDNSTIDFDFDMLGRLRGYETSSRDSTFDYDGIKRLGDFDNSDDEWHRYHWGNAFLGYQDDTNTYYIMPDIFGSTEVIFDDNGIVNRLEYDHHYL
ncbi:hypothetical protein DRQ33_05665 [bacterium]|nr:MAG: hypothetical protein DRQ33_05665 [bacterium]